MTQSGDSLRLLASSNPVPPSAVVGRAGSPEADDTLRRIVASRPTAAQPRHTSRTPSHLTPALVALVALLFAAAAYAVAHEFLVGDPAPLSVQSEAARLGERRGELLFELRTSEPAAVAEETRLGAVIEASTGRVYLWVAPSVDGGTCTFLHVVGTEQPDARPNLNGGCGTAQRPIDAGVSGTRVRDGSWLSLLSGSVGERVERLELEIAGRRDEVALQGRFFLHELAVADDEPSPALTLIAYDRNGRELGRQTHRGSRRLEVFLERFRELSARIDAGARPIFETRTRARGKRVALYVFEIDGRTCKVLVVGGTKSGGCASAAPAPREILVDAGQIGSAPNGIVLLHGRVGEAIERLELHFEDGRVERLRLAGRWTVYQVDEADYAGGRRPAKIVGKDSDGEVVAEKKFPW